MAPWSLADSVHSPKLFQFGIEGVKVIYVVLAAIKLILFSYQLSNMTHTFFVAAV